MKQRSCKVCHKPTEGQLPTCQSCQKDAHHHQIEQERQDGRRPEWIRRLADKMNGRR